MRDPKNPKGIDFNHGVFKQPREHWQKILSSKNMKDVDPTELMKLLMLYPGTKNMKTDGLRFEEDMDAHDELESQVNSPLLATLPKI